MSYTIRLPLEYRQLLHKGLQLGVLTTNELRNMFLFSKNKSIEKYPIFLIDFEDFKKRSEFPRLPENNDIVVDSDDVDKSNSFIIFISHCWLRGSPAAPGYDKRPHPDNAKHEKFKLCVEGIESSLKIWAPGFGKCYVWLDYGCINQNENPAAELKQLDTIVQMCDMLFTPMIDDEGVGTFKCKGWIQGKRAYSNRAWCRVEMLYASVVPVFEYANADERNGRMRGAMFFAKSRGIRLHSVYGTAESENEYKTPICVPPIQYSYFKQYDPMQGKSTVKKDMAEISKLMEEVKPYIKSPFRGSHHIIRTNRFSDLSSFLTGGRKTGKGKIVYSDHNFVDGAYETMFSRGEGAFTRKLNGLFEMKNALIESSKGQHVYEGDLVKGMRHGWGTYTWGDNERRYEGQWKNNNMTGQGCMIFSDGSKYIGEFKEGENHGFGTYYTAEYDFYEGQFIHNKLHGQGVHINCYGSKYTGNWCDGEKSGVGKYEYFFGDVYEGVFMHNSINGLGSYTYANGTILKGEFINAVYIGRFDGRYNLNGQKMGSGTYIFGNGDVFIGSYVNDSREGVGKMVYVAGGSFEGTYLKDKQAKGREKYPNGEVYEGTFKGGKWHGSGKIHFANGNVYEGAVFEGKMHGRGVLRYANGDVYKGGFALDKYHGNGKLTSASGQKIIKGYWEQGQITPSQCCVIA